MEWIKEILPYITWIALIITVFAPSSKSKKIKELENRIVELEKKNNKDIE